MNGLKKWGYLGIIALNLLSIEGEAKEGIFIYSQAFGDKTQPAIILNAGAGGQSISWPTQFCEQLAHKGYYVIRYDYRDTGLSTEVDYTKSPYTVMDLAKDAIGVLQSYDVPKAHFVGFSMGGQLSQLVGAYSPDHAKSLVLIATSTDFKPSFGAFIASFKHDSQLSTPIPEYVKWVARPVDVTKQSLDEKINDYVVSWKILDGSPVNYDEAFYREQGKENYTRTQLHQAFNNHAKAMFATFDQHEKAHELIKHPTLIIHGEKDPVFPSDHGHSLAKKIPHAKLVMWSDFGHAISPRNFDRLVNTIDSFVKAQERDAA